MRRPATSTLVAAALVATPSVAFAASDFKIFPDVPHTLINLVIFAALVWPVNRLLIQPLLSVIEAREERTEGALAKAQGLGEEAARASADLGAELTSARAAAAEARAAVLAEAESEERELIGTARDAATATVREVRDAIAQELESARDTLRADAQSLAGEAAARILGRAL